MLRTVGRIALISLEFESLVQTAGSRFSLRFHGCGEQPEGARSLKRGGAPTIGLRSRAWPHRGCSASGLHRGPFANTPV
jgi:hypothetical protein